MMYTSPSNSTLDFQVLKQVHFDACTSSKAMWILTYNMSPQSGLSRFRLQWLWAVEVQTVTHLIIPGQLPSTLSQRASRLWSTSLQQKLAIFMSIFNSVFSKPPSSVRTLHCPGWRMCLIKLFRAYPVWKGHAHYLMCAHQLCIGVRTQGLLLLQGTAEVSQECLCTRLTRTEKWSCPHWCWSAVTLWTCTGTLTTLWAWLEDNSSQSCGSQTWWWLVNNKQHMEFVVPSCTTMKTGQQKCKC